MWRQISRRESCRARGVFSSLPASQLLSFPCSMETCATVLPALQISESLQLTAVLWFMSVKCNN